MSDALKVSEVMRDCHSATVPCSITVREAAERLMVGDSSVLIAVDESGRLAGQICESEIVRQLLQSEGCSTSIEGLLTCYVESVYDSAELKNILHLFRASQHEALPVLSRDRTVVGILSRHDIVRWLLSTTSARVDSNSDNTPAADHGMKPHILKTRANPRSAPKTTE